MTERATLDDRTQTICIAILVAMLLCLLAAYGTMLSITFSFWKKPEYSHGFLVPAFAAVLLWMRWQPFVQVPNSERWWGVAILGGSLTLRLAVAYFSLIIPDMIMMVPAIAGLFVVVGGWHALKWSWPAIVFLVFMYPLPDFLERSLLMPLQRIATIASTYVLQIIGLGAIREGSHIILGELRMHVVDACAGLRMLTIFFALCIAVIMVTDRPIWERIVIVASALPIALAVNIARITITALLTVMLGEEVASNVDLHGLAGWVMVPAALGLLYLEMQVLANLFIEEEAPAALDLTGGAGAPVSPV